MRTKVLAGLVLIVVLLGMCACSPQAATQVAPPAVPESTATGVPVATAEPASLTVMSAASLTESFTELGRMFEAQHPGVKVSFNFAGSQTLAEQLNQGAPADVFASASKKYMDAAVTAGRVSADASAVFVMNRLVVIFPKDNPGKLAALSDLAKPGLKLVLAAESVPVGQYSLTFLEKANADTAFTPQYKDEVLKNVVSFEDNVKAVVTKVALGEADAGIVYVTDFTGAAAEKVATLEIPDALNTIATYPIAPVADSKQPDLARAFVDLVLSAEGQQVMAKYGFLPGQ